MSTPSSSRSLFMEAAFKTLPSPSQIASTEKVRDPKISPDGNFALYQVQPFYKSSANITFSELWIVDINVAGSSRLLVSDARSGAWCGQTKVLFISKEGALCFISVEASSAATVELISRGVKGFLPSPDGRRVAFTCPDWDTSNREEDCKVFGGVSPSLARMQLYSLDTRKVFALPNLDTTRDVESFSWSPDGRYLLCRLRERRIGEEGEGAEHSVSLQRVAVSNSPCQSHPAHILSFPRSPSGQSLWMPSGHVVTLQNYDPENPVDARALFIYDLAGRGVMTLYGVKEDAVRIVDMGGAVAVEVSTDVDTRIDVLTFTGSSLPRVFTLYRTHDEAIWFGSWDARRVDVDNEVQYICASVLSSGVRHESPNLWSIRVKERDVRWVKFGTHSESCGTKVKLSSHLQWLSAVPHIPTRVVRWVAKDGTMLSGLVRCPPGCDLDGAVKKLATILFIHGGPYRRDVPDYMPYFCNWRELFAGAGYLVISPNYRGSQGRGHAFARAASLSRSWSDCESMLDEVVRRGWADKDRIGVAGWSHGGSLTAYGITQRKTKKYIFKAAIVGAGVSNWEGMVLESGAPALEAKLGGAGAAPWDRQRGLFSRLLSPKPRSPVHLAGPTKDTTHILLLHGEKDERVPPGQAMGLYRVLKRTAGFEVELVMYPNEGHGFVNRDRAENVMDKALAHIRAWV